MNTLTTRLARVMFALTLVTAGSTVFTIVPMAHADQSRDRADRADHSGSGDHGSGDKTSKDGSKDSSHDNSGDRMDGSRDG